MRSLARRGGEKILVREAERFDLAQLHQLGAGAALSVADLDLRGGGDLFGSEQAGHLRRVGTEMALVQRGKPGSVMAAARLLS